MTGKLTSKVHDISKFCFDNTKSRGNYEDHTDPTGSSVNMFVCFTLVRVFFSRHAERQTGDSPGCFAGLLFTLADLAGCARASVLSNVTQVFCP